MFICQCRFLIFGGIIIYCCIFPILYFIGPEQNWFSKAEISYAAIMYILVLNTLVLIGIGYCVAGCLTYPYSNIFFNGSHQRQTNERFGNEFIKCTERICRVIQDMIDTQGTQNTSAILMAPMDQSSETNTAASETESNINRLASTAVQLNFREIYTRVASNIELIGLYVQINEKILHEGQRRRYSRLFRQLTTTLQEIKQTLDRIELRLTFQHPWFPQGKFISFWFFYNKVN